MVANPKKYTDEFIKNYIQGMIKELIQIDREGYENSKVDERLSSS